MERGKITGVQFFCEVEKSSEQSKFKNTREKRTILHLRSGGKKLLAKRRAKINKKGAKMRQSCFREDEQPLKWHKPSESLQHELFNRSKEGEAGEEATGPGPYSIYFKKPSWQARSRKPSERNGERNLVGKIKENNGKVGWQLDNTYDNGNYQLTCLDYSCAGHCSKRLIYINAFDSHDDSWIPREIPRFIFLTDRVVQTRLEYEACPTPYTMNSHSFEPWQSDFRVP